MNRIRLLSEQVANQIAAGEVIERPASVVKELVENALDAGAARISVEIQAGGRSLIRVTDDGIGMSRDDALLCLERHATSKIQRAEDLAAIATMGFRGEALPSIASVSRVTITTRERDSAAAGATQVVINGGKILEVKEASGAPGTAMEVRQLFFNLPARRKFLRGEETERSHIQHYLMLAALAHAEVGFTFTNDGRVVWQLPPLKIVNNIESRLRALHERLRALYGAELKLLPVQFETEFATGGNDFAPDETKSVAAATSAAALRVWGFVGVPGVSRATRQDQHLFVNRRPVENRGLNFALLEGYHTALMKGRYPVCCLFLEIDPGEVDVNIHPAKREVKFHREAEVRRAVAQAVRETLLRFHAGATAPSQPGLTLPPSAAVVTRSKPSDVVPKELSAATPELPKFPPLPTKPIAAWPASVSAPSRERSPTTASSPQRPVSETGEPPAPVRPASSPPSAPLEVVPLLRVPLRLLGVIGKLYVVLESDRGLVLLDQHAAHERILFEQMLRRGEQGDAPAQRLLLPETVELSPRDAQFLREQLPELTRLGVGLSEFGERTFLLDALPPFVKVADARRFVIELIDELKAAGQAVNAWRLGEHTVAKTVCRHAVKANDALGLLELENLVNDLRACAMPYTCPHGRPTLIEMNFRELEKKFGRIQ
ncbi:MAG: DNA mismatch repair endonuclease MutL [Verrucomicrobia bacterium]|nr:DNA mismatch repair endonuclease MutL [Verrucomicrobiota bacterium]